MAGLDRLLVSRRFGRGWAGCGLARVVSRPIATWTGGDSALEGPSAAGELAKLDSGRLDHFETLPAYWLS